MESRSIRTLLTIVGLAAATVLPAGCNQGPFPCSLSSSLNSSCCNGNAACTIPQHLYITTASQVLSYGVDRSTGAPIFIGSVAGPGNPGGVLAASGTNYVYVSDFAGNAVDGFGSNGGTLTPVSGSPFPGVTGPAGLTSRFTFLFVPNFNGNSVSAFSIGQNGALTTIAGSPFAAVSGPKAVAANATHFLYVSNSTDPLGEISGYSVDQNTGALTPVPGSPFVTKLNAAPGAIVVPGLGKFLFVALTNDNSVAAFAIDSNGALTPVAGSPFAAGSQPLDLAADAGGSFLYTADGNGNAVTGFVIASDGSLSAIPGSPFPTGIAPSRLILDGRGHLYVTGRGSNSLFGFAVTSGTGALTSLSGFPFNLGHQPISITVGF